MEVLRHLPPDLLNRKSRNSFIAFHASCGRHIDGEVDERGHVQNLPHWLVLKLSDLPESHSVQCLIERYHRGIRTGADLLAELLEWKLKLIPQLCFQIALGTIQRSYSKVRL